MEVLDEQAALLSDFEVFDFLRELKESRDSKDTKSKDKRDKGKEKKDEETGELASVDYQLRKYFTRRPCSQQSEAQVLSFLERLKELELSKMEKLQLLNYRPQSMVDLFVIIENLEGRFTEDDINQLLQIVEEELPYQAPA